jgi:L-ascorbate metabolism protein UlaG (beta-lactamase superfamily)
LIKHDRSTIKEAKVKSTGLNRSSFDRVQVTFVGNSGFLIAAGDRKVLIDAFFEGFPPGYILPANVRDLLVNAQPPFDHVDLILATHAHGDHFSAAMVRQYLQTCPNAVFVSTTQAASQLPGFGDRVIAADPVEASPVRLEANGIRVEAIYMSHGYPPNDPKEIFNNAYIVTLNGTTFFHTGDIADLRDVEQYRLADKHLDMAFIQHFHLLEGGVGDLLKHSIRATWLFPIHYQFTEPVFDAGLVLSNYPQAVLFNNELESWFMPAPKNDPG